MLLQKICTDRVNEVMIQDVLEDGKVKCEGWCGVANRTGCREKGNAVLRRIEGVTILTKGMEIWYQSARRVR